MQISLVYFQFQVVTEMKVILPEKHQSKLNNVNICTWKYQLKNETIFKKHFKESNMNVGKGFILNMTVEEQFQIAIRAKELFTNKKYERKVNIIEFMFNSWFCFQLQDVKFDVFYFLEQRILTEVQYIWLSSSLPYPDIDEQRIQTSGNVKDDLSPPLFLIQSYSYIMKKLQWPHSDNCINYQDLGFNRQQNAIDNCINDLLMQNEKKMYRKIMILRNDSKLNSYKSYIPSYINLNSSVAINCKRKFENNDDCYTESVFSLLKSQESAQKEYGQSVLVLLEPSQTPSMNIESKTKLAIVEYLTYILGALGSWLGFSFIGCNPVPCFLAKKKLNQPTPRIHNVSLTRQSLVSMRKHISTLYSEIDRMKLQQSQIT